MSASPDLELERIAWGEDCILPSLVGAKVRQKGMGLHSVADYNLDRSPEDIMIQVPISGQPVSS